MTFIYNKKITDVPPEPVSSSKKIKVELEDVMLSFLGVEIKGKSVIISYSISYFNIPSSVSEALIERKIDKSSLEKVIKETIVLDSCSSVYSLNAKTVKIQFDVKKFLGRATYPANLIRKSNFEVILKLSKNVPSFVSQACDNKLSIILSDNMTSLVRSDKKFGRMISAMNIRYSERNTILNALYNENTNSFTITIDNPYKLLYYYV